MRYAIYACEGNYGGLHGIYNVTVMDGTLQEAKDWGYEASCELIQDHFENEIEEIGKNYGEGGIEDYFHDNIEYHIWEIDEDKAKKMATEDLDEVISRLGYEIFIEDYCKKESVE